MSALETGVVLPRRGGTGSLAMRVPQQRRGDSHTELSERPRPTADATLADDLARALLGLTHIEETP